MTRKNLLRKIDKLIDLCVETEPNSEEMKDLNLMFSNDFIQSKEIRNRIDEDNYSN